MMMLHFSAMFSGGRSLIFASMYYCKKHMKYVEEMEP